MSARHRRKSEQQRSYEHAVEIARRISEGEIAMPTVRKERCRDCAFLDGSPEREIGSGGRGAFGCRTMVEAIRERLCAGDESPFFCHEGTVTVESEPGWRATTGLRRDANGNAIPPPFICAGFAAMHDEIKALG